MLDALKSLFAPSEPTADQQDDPIELAVTAMLVEAAMADGEFDANEHEAIEHALTGRFGLSLEVAKDHIAEAEQKVAESVELYTQTRAIRDALDHDGRIEVIELLWQVVAADGAVHDYEANLIRRTAGLLYVTDQEAGAARKRALGG